MNANEILKKYEDANEMHFHEVDRKWIIEAIEEYAALRQPLVSGALPSDDEIRGGADEWVFDINGMKWSNNDDTAGDNYGSFIAGAKWVLSHLSNDR